MMIASHLVYLALFGALFFMPGFFVTVILGLRKFRFLLALALSYALLALTLLPFQCFARSVALWQACVMGAWALLAAGAVCKTAAARASWRARGRRPNAARRFWKIRRLAPLVLAGVVCGYLAYAGVYLEIPSDVWNHVQLFRTQHLRLLGENTFPPGVSCSAVLFPRGTGAQWYFLHAWMCRAANLPIMASLPVLTWLNVLAFLLAFYYFGLFLFAGLRIGTRPKIAMAAAAALFAAATMGNMVFAYIRYYALAPTMRNYVVFLAAMAVIAAWLRSGRWRGHALWIAPVLLAAANMIHTQEALFIFFMTWALSLAESAKILGRKFVRREAGGRRWTAREWKPLGLALALALVFGAGFLAIRQLKPGAWFPAMLPPAGLPAEPHNLILENLPLSLPPNPWLRLAVCQLYIFYQTVGCWGLLVCLLFAALARRFGGQPYLVAGMAAPFLTAFNPLMVDMMVRMGQAATLYRFHYLVPLPFVAAWLLVYFAGRAREWSRGLRPVAAAGGAPLRPAIAWLNYGGCLLILAGLVGLVFPIDAAGIYAPYSKVATLRKIPAGNDYRLIDDLGRFMAQYEDKVVLTDRWTAGFLVFYAPKNAYLYRPWLSSPSPDAGQPRPYTWATLRRRGLVIINRRDGAPSLTGKIARHWPEDALPHVSRFYSLAAQHYLESHPEQFRKIWARNRIAVYAVR